MSRRWKETTMLVVVTIALINTILTVNSSNSEEQSDGTDLTDYKLKPRPRKQNNKFEAQNSTTERNRLQPHNNNSMNAVKTKKPEKKLSKFAIKSCPTKRTDSYEDAQDQQDPVLENSAKKKLIRVMSSSSSEADVEVIYENREQFYYSNNMSQNEIERVSDVALKNKSEASTNNPFISNKYQKSKKSSLKAVKAMPIFNNSNHKIAAKCKVCDISITPNNCGTCNHCQLVVQNSITDMQKIQPENNNNLNVVEFDSHHSDNKNYLDEYEKIYDSNNEFQSEIQRGNDVSKKPGFKEIDKVPSLKDWKMSSMKDADSYERYNCDDDESLGRNMHVPEWSYHDAQAQIKNANEFAETAEKDGKQRLLKKLLPSEKEASKKENLFQHYLKDQDLVKNALIHATRANSFQRVPENPSDEHECIPENSSERTVRIPVNAGEGNYVSWNCNVKKVVRVQITPEVQDFQSERLKFVNAFFSEIPRTESPTDYDFYFDTTRDFKSWFMLAVHKRNKELIGKQWSLIPKPERSSKIVNWEPCKYDAQNRWITKLAQYTIGSDEFCKALLSNGFNFAPNRKRKREKSKERDHLPEKILNMHQIGRERRVEEEKMKQEQYEHNLTLALESKFEKSSMFLLASFCNLEEKAPQSSSKPGDFMLLTKDSSCFSWNNVMTSESWTQFSFDITDELIKKAFKYGLVKPFELMMKSRNWPEDLWNNVLESETQQSKEMVRLICKRIKTFEQTEHLKILLMANANGNMPFFEKIMQLAVNENPKNNFLTEQFQTQTLVLRQLYQYLLFFGVAKADKKLVDFALNGSQRFRASLQEKTDGQIALALEKKCSWRKKGKNSSSEDQKQKKEDTLDPTEQECKEDEKILDQITDQMTGSLSSRFAIKQFRARDFGFPNQNDTAKTMKKGSKIFPVKKELTEDDASLENKTALEIATILWDSQELAASPVDKRNLRNIKIQLEKEAKRRCKVKKEVKKSTILRKETEAEQKETVVKAKVFIDLETDSEDEAKDKKVKDAKK